MFVYFPMLVLGYVAGMTLAWHEAGRRGFPQRALVDMALAAFLAALLGSKLFHALFDGFLDHYLNEPWELLMVWRGGQVFYGGLVFGLLAAFLVGWKKRLPVWKWLDVVTPAIMLGLAIGRVGCYLAGCCYGKPTTLPWGIQYGAGYPATKAQIAGKLISPEAHYCLPIHPAQLYEAVLAFIICVGALVVSRKKTLQDGRLFLLVLALYAIGRFFLEFLRADPRGTILASWLSTSQVASIVVLMAALGAVVWQERVRRRTR